MNAKYAKTIFDRPVYILVILAVTLMVTTGAATWRAAAQGVVPRLTVSITDDWFRIEGFPQDTSLTISIYASKGGELMWRESRTADENGYAFVGSWETGVDLAPAMYLEVFSEADGVYKDIELEPVLLYVFDTDNNFLAGSAPPDRHVWVGAGNESNGCSMDVTSNTDGTWEADFNSLCDVESDMWGAAQVFDEDGDATEANPGFPRGSHDYDTGDVPSWACNVGGWVFDPDEQGRPVTIRILSDGGEVMKLEVNADGNHSYEAPLWGLISSYEPHEITVEAFDQESNTWRALDGTPRPLTCRTYDIYAYDPITGETTQITNMQDADEYNPSWSPNGKLVAHSTVFPDYYGIYITDVATGVSSPLAGGEYGGAAVFAPFGERIVFDRDDNIYISSAEGGDAKLVRADAVSADWAPNGKRLVFQQKSDGSIRTIAVSGGKGGETIVAGKGSTPSWSPDGSWIAYEFNGDIWKVAVNVQGVVLGVPVHVTSLAAGEGHPTWSADSQTIVYHAGLSRDYDLWTIPAAGGEPTWLTGAPEFGDYDPSYAKNSNTVAYASFSPEGQAARHWGSTFTYDLPAGTLNPGDHSYYFENAFTFPQHGGGPTDPVNFSVSEGVEAYDGYALLRPYAIQAHAWGDCRYIDAINPFQATRFLYGWVTDDLLTYQEAVMHFNSMEITAYLDDGSPMNLTQRHEIFPGASYVDWFGYRCSFTEPPPLIKVQITDNWFEAQRFLPNTELVYQIYDSPGGNLLLDGVMGSDDSGTAGIWVGDQVDLVPGQHIVVSDGYSTKDIQLEPIAFDRIDLDTGHAEGSAPEPSGRTIWVGIGFPDAGWDRWVPTDDGGNWAADFEQPIPVNFDWIVARAFDGDGDISEVRPDTVLGTWVGIYHYIIPAGEWSEGDHYYKLTDGQTEMGPVNFSVSSNAPLYNGYALLRGNRVIANTGEGCQEISEINPDQLTRFHNGMVSDGSITYEQAKAQFEGFHTSVTWDGGDEVELVLKEIRLFSLDTWWDYVCSETAGPPKMDLRVNYGHDWVESFYEAGHEVEIRVTDSEDNEKATATVFTEPKDFWGGETGFQTTTEDWNPSAPDLQPYDRVYARIDNAVTYQVQLGDISGEINLDDDSIQGAINAPWISGEVSVECHPWGSPNPVDMKFDSVAPDGEDTYSCSWAGEWDIEYYQDVGVGYFDPDGNWVANAFFVRNPRFTVFPEWEWFDGLDWPDGAAVTITVLNKPECEVTKESWGYFFNGNFGEGCDLEIGDEVTFTDGITTRTHTVRNLAVTDLNKEENTIAGTADAGAVVYVWPHDGWFEPLQATADGNGEWQVDLDDVGYDLEEEASGRSQISDDAGNATAVDWYLHIPNPYFIIYPDAQWLDGADWPDGEVTITVVDKCTFTRQSAGGFFNGSFPEGCIVAARDEVTFEYGDIVRTHTVRNLAIKIIDKEANTVTGEADSGEQVFVWAWYMDGSTVEGSNTEVTAEDGTWTVDYNALGIDLVLGMGIQAEIRDANGNATSVDLLVPDPRIVASITENWFYLADFIPGSSLELSIYDSQGDQRWHDTSRTSNVNGFAWINFEEHGVDLEPGNHLVVSDGTTIKDLVIEWFTFDVFDLTGGLLMGSAPGPEEGRRVWAGIGFENDAWSMDVLTDPSGNWIADFGAPAVDFTWAAAQVFDQDGDASELRPRRIIGRSMSVGNFSVKWDLFNPEEIVGLSWRGSENLTNPWQNPFCEGDLEFFGNSWVTENETTDQFFFASLVGWGSTGSWSQNRQEAKIASVSSGCPGSADIPVETSYEFFDDEARVNLIIVEREFEFGDTPYAHNVRPFIPRLYPFSSFTDVYHPSADGTLLLTDYTCDFGCEMADWNGTWFAIHDPSTGMGMIVMHEPSAYDVTLWLDNDGGSYTNATSVLLRQPSGGFTGTVKETEYLCFYDSSTWTPSLETLPTGCQP